MAKKIEPNPTVQQDMKPSTLAHIRDTFQGLWCEAMPDTIRPNDDTDHYYLLLTQGKGGLHLAPSLYTFVGWAWVTVDDRSDERVEDDTVVAWYPVRITDIVKTEATDA